MENENKLPEEFKAKWCAALRSGEYKQCTMRQMAYEGTYCCLAVACKIAGVPEAEIFAGHELLPVAIRGGISASHQELPSARLIAMNDGYDYGIKKFEGIKQHSFEEIATYIEENL